jgi:hypothetical protein
MSDKDVEIDPRFDPAFQRGFDPSIPIDEYVPAPLPRTTAVPTRFAPAPAESSPVATAPAVQKAVRPEPELVVVNGDEDPETVIEPVTESDLDSSPSRNPFLLFLLVIAIALVVAGIWLFVRSGDAFNSREVPSQGDFMSLTATLDAAPFIALLGAATAIGVLFVFASKWRKRR